MTTIADRAANEGLCAMGLRFSEDWMSPRDRFTALKDRLGDAFEVIEIDSRPGNEHGFGKAAHSVLTDEVREVDGQPAYEARKRVVEFLTAAADLTSAVAFAFRRGSQLRRAGASSSASTSSTPW